MTDCDCGHCLGSMAAMDFLEKKLCPAGKAAAKRKFKVYPSAYANGWAVQYCKGKFKGKKKSKVKKADYPEMGPTPEQIFQASQKGFRKPISQLVPTDEERRQRLLYSLTPEEKAVLMEQAKQENIQPYSGE